MLNSYTPKAREKAADNDGRVLGLCRSFLRHRRLVIVLFVVVAAICAACTPFVKVNYSFTDYLPADSPSTVALDDMEEAFGAGIPNARIYAEGIDLATAERLSNELADIDGVDEVMWLGTVEDVKVPAAMQDEELRDSWTTGEGYLYQLTLDAGKAIDALPEARATAEATGATVSMDGSMVSTVEMQVSTATQVALIMLAGVLIIIVILLFTSHSWFEPVIFLVTIGAAILMNMGTNLVMGEISFVSQICGAILQLAVSMDYAIVLLHTYRRCQRKFVDPLEAMAHAMRRGFSVVLSSAAVTFFGFLSLCVMRFGIGVNMGIVLAKGIVFSFLSVMFFMPCLILACRRPLERLQHRYLVPSLDKLARGCQKVMVPAAVVVILVAIPCFLAENRTDFTYGTGRLFDEESSVMQQQRHIEDAFGASETWVLMVPQGQWAHEQALLDRLDGLAHVTGTTSYLTVAGKAMPVEVVPEGAASQVLADGWSRIIVTNDAGVEGDVAFGLVEDVRDAAREFYGDDYRLVGNAVGTYDLRDVVHEDSTRVQLFSMLAIGIVLALMFRSLTIPLVMLLAIEVSIWINLAVPYFMGDQLNYIGYLVIDAVQLGAAVDYAIIYAREYFERRKLYGPGEAARSAIKHGGVPILTSASILICAGIAVWLISTNMIISELGGLIARGAFIAMLMMFLFLPWLFKTFDGVICRTSMGLKGLRRRDDMTGTRRDAAGKNGRGEEKPR